MPEQLEDITITPTQTQTPKKIFLSYPVHHDPVLDSIISLYKACATTKHQVEIWFHKGDSMVTRVRNNAISTFIYERKDYDYFMTIDSDLELQNIYKNNNIFDILVEDDKDFNGGLYSLKNEYNQCSSVSADYDPITFDAGLVEMKYLSSGCHLIKREAILKIADRNKALKYVGDGMVFSGKEGIALYNPIIRKTKTEYNAEEQRRLLSEDWAFCHRAHEVGIKIYADTAVGLIHHGSKKYSLFGYVPQIEKTEAKLYNGDDEIPLGEIPFITPDMLDDTVGEEKKISNAEQEVINAKTEQEVINIICKRNEELRK